MTEGTRRSATAATVVRATVLAALTLALLALALLGVGAGPGRAADGQVTRSFSYTGEEQTFTVPSGVREVHVLAVGGKGSEGGFPFTATGGRGGFGAMAQADIVVTPGQKLYVEVGGNGTGWGPNSNDGGVGGFNGGGDPGTYVAGGGGGASDLRTCSRLDAGCNEALGTGQDPRLLVAGGGGGGGGGGQISSDEFNEGDGGWGGNAGNNPEAGRNGRNVSWESVPVPGGRGGGAGTSSAGGVGGAGGSVDDLSGGNGTAATGGDGGGQGGAGGGGGGGYFGGGGGGAGAGPDGEGAGGGGGGGAGSSFVTPAASNPSIGGDPNGAPRVVISYPQPAPAVSVVPVSGLSTTGATLGAIVNPNGADTTYRFEYWTTDPSSKIETQEGTVAADGVRFVSASIEGLQPDTTYNYRLVATNSGGTTTGAEQAFATPAEPLPPNADPEITVLGPTPGSKISDRTPTVKATAADSGTDLSKADLRLWVDGKQVEAFSYDRSNDRLSYTMRKLDPGRHTVLVVARDEQGLSASRFWGFGVAKR